MPLGYKVNGLRIFTNFATRKFLLEKEKEPFWHCSDVLVVLYDSNHAYGRPWS